MSKGVPAKVVISALLAAAAVSGRTVDAITWGLLAFGIFNVIFFAPGVRWITAPGVAVSLGALMLPGDFRMLGLLFAWLVWPPLFLAAWSVARDVETPPEQASSGRQARLATAAIIAAVALAAIAYRIILGHGLAQSAALFVGLPALLAIVVTLAVSPRSATGVACKAVTIGLLVSLLFLGEGILCVAMSAPLFYLVALAIGAFADRAHRGFDDLSPTTLSCVAVLVVLPMSLEGVTETMSFSRDESVTATKIVHASSDAVGRAVFEPPRFSRALPLYLRAGFPRPTAARVESDATGARLVVRLRGGEMRLDGMEPRAGDLTLQLEEARPGYVRWKALSDDSHMTHFLSWREAVVQWEAVDANTTRVTWTLRYSRGLDPAWYFGPWERYAAHLAAGYLIDAVAMP